MRIINFGSDSNCCFSRQKLGQENSSKTLLLSCLCKSHKELCCQSTRSAHRGLSQGSIKDSNRGFFFSACRFYPPKLPPLTLYWFPCIRHCKEEGCLSGSNLIYWSPHSLLQFISFQCTTSEESVFSSSSLVLSTSWWNPPQHSAPCFPNAESSWTLHPEWQHSLDLSFWSRSCLFSWGLVALAWGPSHDFGWQFRYCCSIDWG